MNNLNKEKISDRQALLGFNYFSKIGPKSMLLLEKYFSSPAQAYLANLFNLEKAGIKYQIALDFINWRKTFSPQATEEKLTKEGVFFITWHDDNYPRLLKEIAAPPFLLYYRGSLEVLNDESKNRLAIVGSRKNSAYAEKIITTFLPDLIEQKVEIVSGLALGIDALAHRATLNNKGITIAVLGTGVNANNIYPRANRCLAEEIIKQGSILISEFPPNTPPLPQNFPQRNRLISGLAQATLIIEAQKKSGSLITANFALNQNREVLAIPGNIFSEFSQGTNNLIKCGAKTITKVEDILEIFQLEKSEPRKKKKIKTKKIILDDPLEKIIYQLLKQANERAEKINIDELVKLSKLDTSVINSKLSILELRGIIKSDGINYDLA
ncbi:DNA-protecting protein DprA [Candidatus Falkowbacteria bacterium]|mgnify:FL=1|jgi:DNA processing protein|nr:DNA-protecting protein DprA [Candidatus Falkowbacteria bacterium]